MVTRDFSLDFKSSAWEGHLSIGAWKVKRELTDRPTNRLTEHATKISLIPQFSFSILWLTFGDDILVKVRVGFGDSRRDKPFADIVITSKRQLDLITCKLTLVDEIDADVFIKGLPSQMDS